MKIYCIYHKGCLDGFTAAWIIRKALDENVEFVGGVYGETPPLLKEKIIYIVDFSYPREVLLEMARKNKTVIVLDHHKSAKEQLADLSFAKFDMDKSGAMMTWEYFYKDVLPYPFILYIQDRDLWKFELKDTKEINAALFSYSMEFEVWDALAAKSISSLRDEGEILLRDRQRHIDSFCKDWVVSETEIAGYMVPCLNCPRFLASDVLSILAKGWPFAAAYFDKANERLFELRSNKDGLDVSEIAQLYGGGGHVHAAGFSVKKPTILGK